MGTDVIIFALGPTSTLCPFDTEVWTVNMGWSLIYKMHGRINKLFTAHRPSMYPALAGSIEQFERKPIYMGWEVIDRLVDFGLEVISLHKIKGVRSKIYPLKRIIKKFGCDYFTDTLCYMIAYAIDKGYKKIRLYGVDMMERDEFKYEKGGIEYWIGFAKGRGIEVTIPEECFLCKTPTGLPFGVKPPKDPLEKELIRLMGGKRLPRQ